MKILLFQRTLSLPVGGKEGNGTETPAPLPDKAPIVAPQSKLRSKPRSTANPPLRSAAVVPSTPVKTPPQLSRLAPPPVAGAAGDGAESALRDGSVTGNAGRGTGEGSDQAGTGAGNGAGHGGGGGMSARPDYGINPKPPYPLIARRLGAQGVVVLRVQVREDGSVAAVELARSSGFAPLDESASRTVRERWRFLPARRNGIPVESWVEIPIRFVLKDS